MFNLNKMFTGGARAESDDVEPSAVSNAVAEKVHEAAGGKFTESEVTRAVAFVIKDAELKGQPLTMEMVASPEFDTNIKNALGFTESVREKVPIVDASGALIANAGNSVEARDAIGKEKGAGGEAHVSM